MPAWERKDEGDVGHDQRRANGFAPPVEDGVRGFALGEPLPGTNWVVRGELGRGGMGVVYEVSKEPNIPGAEGLCIPGAAKVLKPSLAQVPRLAQGFLQEARVLLEVEHEHLVKVNDVGRLSDGTPFMVMELLKGGTLRALMKKREEKSTRGGGTLPARTAFDIIRELCDGLSALHTHRRPLVHRDVKPENIFLHAVPGAVGGRGVVKVLDVGLTCVGGEANEVVGTPRYMAPEQILGEMVTEKTDLYSVALILYELLAGRRPWDVDVRDSEAMMRAHLHAEPKPLSQQPYCSWVPADVCKAISRALSKSPASRPANVAQFVDLVGALNDVNDGSAYVNVNANTTAPTLAGLAAAARGWKTDPQMNIPPVEGPSPVAAAAPAAEMASGRDPSEVQVARGSEHVSDNVYVSHPSGERATVDSGDRTTVPQRRVLAAVALEVAGEREAVKETVKQVLPDLRRERDRKRRQDTVVVGGSVAVGFLSLCGVLAIVLGLGGRRQGDLPKVVEDVPSPSGGVVVPPVVAVPPAAPVASVAESAAPNDPLPAPEATASLPAAERREKRAVAHEAPPAAAAKAAAPPKATATGPGKDPARAAREVPKAAPSARDDGFDQYFK